MKQFAQRVLAISLFFWCWALYNTFKMTVGLDLGIISFFTTMMSSTYLLLRNTEKNLKKAEIMVVTFTHLIVAANYALGFWFALTIDENILHGFATYCFLFTWLWIYCAKIGWDLLTELRFLADNEKEDLKNLYDFDRSDLHQDPGSFSYY